MVDTVLSGGLDHRRHRTPPYQADLCIQDGKIVAISLSGRVIAARGWMSPEKSSLRFY